MADEIPFTSIVKSQSGDGVRRCVFSAASMTDGEPLGSSGITANRPRCIHGDVAPYEAEKSNKKPMSFFVWRYTEDVGLKMVKIHNFQ